MKNSYFVYMIMYVLSTCFCVHAAEVGREGGENKNGYLLCKIASSFTGEEFDKNFKLLIKRGVNVNDQRLSDGATALHVSKPENIKKLILAGADIRIRDNMGQTPFGSHLYQILHSSDAEECVKQLIKYGVSTSEEELCTSDIFCKLFRELPISKMKEIAFFLFQTEIYKDPMVPIEPLYVLAFKALGEEVCNIFYDRKIEQAFYPCVDKYIIFLAKKKIFEAKIYIQCHCPKIGPKTENMVGFMENFVTRYIKEESEYELDERIKDVWGKSWWEACDNNRTKIRIRIHAAIAPHRSYLRGRVPAVHSYRNYDPDAFDESQRVQWDDSIDD
jgi:hypothetical protein